MAKISTDLSVSTLHPRENLFVSGNIAALNAEVITRCDGSGSVSLDLRGTAVLSMEVSGTVDGTNWTLIPVRPINLAGIGYITPIVYPVGGGIWVGSCAGFRQVRARCTAWTSGNVTAVLNVSTLLLDQSLQGMVTTNIGTQAAASGAICTLSLAAPGPGLRHYITYVSIQRTAAAMLVAGAAPVTSRPPICRFIGVSHPCRRGGCGHALCVARGLHLPARGFGAEHGHDDCRAGDD